MSEGRLVVNTAEVSAKVIDGDAVIINLSTGVYFSTAGSGAMAWALIEAGHDRDGVAAALAEHFGTDAGVVGGDLNPFYADLQARHLLVEGAETAAVPTPVSGFPTGDYAAPTLEVYSDMADLLALDPPMPGLQDIPWSDPGTGSETAP